MLRKERPRAGRRKAIEKDEDEEDKKDTANAALEDKLKTEKEGEAKEVGVIVTKASNIPAISNLLANHNVSLQTTKNLMGGRKVDDGKETEQRKKGIKLHVNALMLNNNELRDLNKLHSTLTFVLPHSDPSRLQWLNLSYNYLTKIDHEILKFPNLKTLQLHGNYIADLEEVRKLHDLGTLQALSLNGNPIEEVKGYRLYVLGIMFSKYETLRKLDSVIITRMEFDNVLVWNERLFVSKTKNLKRLRPDNPKKPPAKEEDENAKGGEAGGH